MPKRWILSVLVKNVSGSLEKFGKKLQQEHPEKDQFGDRTNWEIFISHLQSIKQYLSDGRRKRERAWPDHQLQFLILILIRASSKARRPYARTR